MCSLVITSPFCVIEKPKIYLHTYGVPYGCSLTIGEEDMREKKKKR